MTETTETRELQCTLTQEDRNDYTKKLTDSIISKSEVEREKKRVAKEYRDEIKDLNNKITTLGMKLDNGYEDRKISCRIEFNVPRYGIKTITRKDDHESWTEEMTDEEWNLFNNETAAEEKLQDSQDGEPPESIPDPEMGNDTESIESLMS